MDKKELQAFKLVLDRIEELEKKLDTMLALLKELKRQVAGSSPFGPFGQ